MEQLDHLPVNSIDCESDLTVFDHLAKQSAMCISQKFTGKGMRYEITLQSYITKV